MRVWFSGPRIGPIRPGVSFGAEDWARPGVRFGGANRPAPVARPSGGDFVYVIAGSHGLVKIGMSADPLRRLSDLQTASPHPLTLAFTIPTYGNAFLIEQEAHRVLNAHRSSGEWFAVSQEMAIAAIYAAADRTGCALASPGPVARSSLPTHYWPRSSVGQVLMVFCILWLMGVVMRLLGV